MSQVGQTFQHKTAREKRHQPYHPALITVTDPPKYSQRERVSGHQNDHDNTGKERARLPLQPSDDKETDKNQGRRDENGNVNIIEQLETIKKSIAHLFRLNVVIVDNWAKNIMD